MSIHYFISLDDWGTFVGTTHVTPLPPIPALYIIENISFAAHPEMEGRFICRFRHKKPDQPIADLKDVVFHLRVSKLSNQHTLLKARAWVHQVIYLKLTEGTVRWNQHTLLNKSWWPCHLSLPPLMNQVTGGLCFSYGSETVENLSRVYGQSWTKRNTYLRSLSCLPCRAV
jgi:hypothetical protein